MPEVEFEGKYGYVRANTDICGQFILAFKYFGFERT
jgi:hypothetical protein